MNLIDKKTLQDVKYYLPDENICNKLAQYFAVFSDLTRVKILSALSITPMCVSDICNVLTLNQTTVSHQLKLLRDCNIVTFDRQGKVLFYKINSGNVNQLLLFGVEHLGY